MQNESLETVIEAKAQDRTADFSRTAVRFLLLLIVACAAPVLGTQALTGTLVNATLFIAAATLGVVPALLIGVIPSVVSAVTGLLPAALLPMVPFIIAGNALLILSFRLLGKGSYWKGAAAASLLKFAFLSATSSLVLGYFVTEKAASQVALMMSWPQLFTALSGGFLAYVALGARKRVDK
jgi:hypothetical protein